ncbi:MAG: PAS domain-containing protein [Anaerolineae bacterium]
MMSVDPEGQLTELETAHRTIAHLEAQLRESQQMLRTILDTIPAYVFWRDMDLRLLGCNQQYAAIAGFSSPDELVGKTDFDVAAPEHAAKFQADDRRVIESARARLNYEEGSTSPDGEPQWFRTSKMPLRDADGNIIGVLGFFQDITEQKLAAAERERLQQQVIDAQRHALQELSTPLIPIMDQILVLPLVGSVDSARSADIMRAVLKGITDYRAKVIILDITGVPLVDTGVADHLNRTLQAARLKGAHTIITGVSDAVAETIVDLGIDWTRVETMRDLQSGLMLALQRLGYRLASSVGQRDALHSSLA